MEYLEKYDVIVCGGGPAGTSAAIRAARNGAKVLLIERQGSLGGTWTVGLMTWLMDVQNKHGILDEIAEKLCNKGSRYQTDKKDFSFFPEDMKNVLEEMALDAGVSLLYHTTITGIIKTENNTVSGVTAESCTRHLEFRAPVIIDATGDGTVSAYAGCKYEMGREQTGELQPMSLMALVSGIAPETARPFCLNYENYPGEAQKNFHRYLEQHKISLSYSMPCLVHLKENLYSIFYNHEAVKSCDDPFEMTKVTLHSRWELKSMLAGLSKLEKAWENVFIVSTGEHIGIREGRRIHGHYYLTKEDLMEGRQFEDGICNVTFNVDIHDGSTHNRAWNHGGVTVKPYQIPLRSLIAADVKGLILAGRLISGDFYAHASYRVAGNILGIGEAAGVLAALSVSTGKLPEEVPYRKVQELLHL